MRCCFTVLLPGVLQFSGRSYLKTQVGSNAIKSKRSKDTLKIQSQIVNENIYLNFSTIQQDGLLVWCFQVFITSHLLHSTEI